MPDDILPSKADERAVKQGIRQVITGVALLITVAFGVGAMTVINKQADAIVALSTSLSAQSQQFDACKGKPATTSGCTQKVSAEPAIIIKQVGAQGLPGSQGIQGIQGIPGTPCLPSNPLCRGPEGKPGPSGPTPACMLLPTKCQGQPGTNGIDGKNGTDGKDGVNGIDGKNGTDGKDGVDGKDGAPGKPASAECIESGNMWGPVEVSRPTPLLPVTIVTCSVPQESP